ncbi:MAG TPA: GNAT family N-acetyltransferase [Streptosporangiaceae bacterium]|nr:GNAT family N-acetyltransferase [Streptosporangiaceae bacterium]
MATSYPIRPVSSAELPAFMTVCEQAFNSTWPAEQSLEIERKLFEPGRSLAAFDGDQMVGTATALSFGLTVPGGAVDCAGVTGVGVLPTHRRRGILSALMRRQLADVSDLGEPVAALFASESAIYRRYGYGLASEQYNLSILASGRPLARAAADEGGQAATAADGLTLRLAGPQSATKELMSVYDTVRVDRPGMLTRSDQWWEVLLADPAFMREGYSPLRCVIAADDTGARGYALYTGKPDWGADSIPAHELVIRELFAVDPAAYAAVWGNLLSRDLVAEVNARMRPTDEPLLHLLANRRAARPRVSDGLWIRLVDLPAALIRRGYACAVDVVIDVTDSLLPANSGRWRLRAGGFADPRPATCGRVSAEPDIALGTMALGAAYLGGTRLGSLAGAGLVTELRPGALAALSAAMSWDPLPWSPMVF